MPLWPNWVLVMALIALVVLFGNAFSILDFADHYIVPVILGVLGIWWLAIFIGSFVMRENPPLIEQMAVTYATEIEELKIKLLITRAALIRIVTEYDGSGDIGEIARKALTETMEI